MVYTVKKLSQLSGLTVRTLHFYEETGLLKPAYYGSNGYRYYEEKQLLELQQILFFKELGFSLKQIGNVLGKSDFSHISALHAHKQALLREWEKIGKLIETVDKTIQHLQGKKKMKDKEFFQGFSEVKIAKGGESYFDAEAIVLRNLRKSAVTDQEKENIAKAGYEIYTKIANCIQRGLDPSSNEVQALTKNHHIFTQKFHKATKKVYKALSQLYVEHPGFRQQLDLIDPKLAKFFGQAMIVFADHELK